MKFQMLTACLASLLLGACASSATEPEVPVAPKEELRFIDLQSFDRELSGSLAAPLPMVKVSFYDHIVPSALPERLQQWMASVEAGGGTVKVTPPKSSVTAKNPFLIISAVSTLWTASKMAKEAAVKAQFQKAQSYDAEILLKVDDKGETVVDQVVFAQRKK